MAETEHYDVVDGFTALAAVAMGVLSFVLARPHNRVHHIHPRPATHLHARAA